MSPHPDEYPARTPAPIDHDMRLECLRRFKDIEGRMNAIDERQRLHGESIVALKTQIIMVAGAGSTLGAMLGGVAVTLLSRFLQGTH